MSKLPSPLDSPHLKDPLECPPLRWGLIGCGRVSHDFCQALKHLPTARVVACAARDASRARSFAEKHGIAQAYGTYEELVNDGDVDIVYVGNVHAFRMSIGELCLKAGKHTLLEKPFACTVEEAEQLIQLAKEKNLFLMEGMWTRFFPAVEHARQLAFGNATGKQGMIGQISAVFSDFNFNASDSEEYPTSFVYNRKLGGGASLLTGPYPIAAATLFFPGMTPDTIKVVGQVDASTGVDLQACISMSYPATSDVSPATDPENEDRTPKLPGAGVANLSYGLLCESIEETTAVGTKGRLTIKSPAHCPTKLVVRLKGDGRGAAAGEMVYEYPLPADTEAIKTAGGFFYPNSAGFCYEAAAVARCIAAGKLEVPQYTLSETMVAMKILEQTRLQLGTKKVSDD